MASVNIGELLKEARLQKNISLDELQQITKVQKRYLTAIENNEFDLLPGVFYVRAFIRQYAGAVGLNGKELVDIFDGKEPEPVVIEEPPKPVYQELDESRTQIHEEEKQASWMVRNLPAIAFSLIGLAIATIVLYIMWQDRKTDPIIQPIASSVSTESTTTPTTTSTTASSSTSESSTTTSTSEEKKAMVVVDSDVNNLVNATVTDATSPMKISFTGKNGPCWIGVMVNGEYTYQQTLQSGQTQTTELPADASSATLIVGASNNVDIQLDGQALPIAETQVLIRKDITVGISYKQ